MTSDMQPSLILFVAFLRGFLVQASYVIEDDYFSSNFFTQFTFWNAVDPTNGFVEYITEQSARDLNMVSGGLGSAARFGADSRTTSPNGRQSVRLTSNKAYDSGLIIADFGHIPGSICGSWPAFWMLGPSWPTHGEIDIIEGVNDQETNIVSLHTGSDCFISNSGDFHGTLTSANCFSTQTNDTGCSITASAGDSYGDGFNNAGGGIYALEWTSEFVSVYSFPRSKGIPSDITSGRPNPQAWTVQRVAQFTGSCDIATSFTNLQIVFDITFCGHWTDTTWSRDSCAKTTHTSCEDYVANNPADFSTSFWSVNSLRVYQDDGGPSSANASTSVTPTEYRPSRTIYQTSTTSSRYLPTALSSSIASTGSIAHSSAVPAVTSNSHLALTSYPSNTATSDSASQSYLWRPTWGGGHPEDPWTVSGL